MEAAYEFLDLYKQLEDALENRLKLGDARRGSVIGDFMNSAEGAPWKERMNLCREIRNVMSHNADLDGEPVVAPSEAVVEALREILQAVRQPCPALDCATPADQLLMARLDDGAVSLMKKMEERGFSHVPVMYEGRFLGVFSVSTVFSAGLQGKRFSLTESTRVRDFEALLPVEKHISERFCFLPEDALLPQAREAFETRGKEKRRRLAAVFLTSDGTSHGRLRGMLTPWDLLRPGAAAGRARERERR